MSDLAGRDRETWAERFAKGVRNIAPPDFPVIVTLCGSTRFEYAFRDAMRAETLAGRIVLSVGLFGHAEGIDMDGPVKAMLDDLHKRKIDLSDEILVLNVRCMVCRVCGKPCDVTEWCNSVCCAADTEEGGYVGSSTRSEVLHARKRGKTVRWLEPDAVPADLKGGAS